MKIWNAGVSVITRSTFSSFNSISFILWRPVLLIEKTVSMQEEFEDTKGVIRIHKSKRTEHNGQKKKDKRTNNDLQNIHIKLNIE